MQIPRSVTTIASVLAFAAASNLAVAQSRAPGPPPARVVTKLFDFDEVLKRELAPGQHAYAFQHHMKLAFDARDGDGDGAITEADRKRVAIVYDSMMRAQQVSRLMQADLNSDGVITREELTLFTRYATNASPGEGPEADRRRADSAQRLLELRMRADTNGDGRIDWQETFAFARANPQAPYVDYDSAYSFLLSLDANRDGKTTRDEYTQAMQKRFDEFDSDGDGIISQAEFDDYWRKSGKPAPQVAAITPNFEERRAAECAVPRPAKNQKFVLFNGYEPAALSTAALGPQNKSTQAVTVEIEPGGESLYLVLNGWSRIIWKFTGAIDRVKRVIAAGSGANEPEGTAAGVVGLPKEVVTIANVDRCGLFWVNFTKNGVEQDPMRAQLLFGRTPDISIAARNIWNVRLPSGHFAVPTGNDRKPPPAGMMPDTDEALTRLYSYYPGGVVDIDAAQVIAGQPVSRYGILPSPYGRWGDAR